MGGGGGVWFLLLSFMWSVLLFPLMPWSHLEIIFSYPVV
jgi:hypothetical protein